MSPEKIIFQNGDYCWDCEADHAFKVYEYRRTLRMGFGVSVMILPLIWLHVALSVISFSLPALVIAYVVAFLIVLITATCILRSKRKRILHFTMTDQEIQIKSGTAAIIICFRSVLRVEEDPENCRFIFRTRFASPVVCVPAEDYHDLRDRIFCYMEAVSRHRTGCR